MTNFKSKFKLKSQVNIIMKILVLSDSHGRKQKVEDLISSTPHDLIFFLGDGMGDFSKYDKNIYKVSGNCDFFSPEAVIRIENISNITKQIVI